MARTSQKSGPPRGKSVVQVKYKKKSLTVKVEFFKSKNTVPDDIMIMVMKTKTTMVIMMMMMMIIIITLIIMYSNNNNNNNNVL